MQARDDETLLRAYAREGDEAAFRELARRYGGLVYGACLRDVRRVDLAEDAAQAVFLDLARKAGRIRPKTSLVPWLYAASRFASRNVLRAERRRPTVPLEDSIPAPDVTSDDALFQALDALSASEREAVVLRFVQGLSLAEVGRAQGVSEDAARMRVQRALKRLRMEYVPALAAPTSLAGRLAVLVLPRPLPLMTTPLLLASGSLAALAVVGAATHRPASPMAPSSTPTVAQTRPASKAKPTALVKTKPAKAVSTSALPTLDKPFTLVYRFTERDLRSKAVRDREAERSRHDALPEVDADRMTPEEMEDRVAYFRDPRPPVEKDVTLSFDGRTLYVECGGETFLVQASRTFDIPPRDANRSPSLHEAYTLWMMPGTLPPIGVSLPHIPFVQDGKTLIDGAPKRDGKPCYNPGRLEFKDGRLLRVVNQFPNEAHPYGITTFAGHRRVQGRAVAGTVVYRERMQDGGATKAQEFRLISASERPLSADRFDPELYLPEKCDFALLLKGADRDQRFTYERTKGSLDEQIQAARAGRR